MTVRRVGALAANPNSETDRDMLLEVVNFIVSKFPSNFFRSISVNDQLYTKSIHNLGLISMPNANFEGGSTPNPLLIVNATRNGNNVTETGWESPRIFDEYVSQNLQQDMTPYRNFYVDEYGIALYRSSIFIRTSIEVTIRVDTRADQDMLANSIDTYLKTQYGYRVDTRKVIDQETGMYSKELADMGLSTPIMLYYILNSEFIELYKSIIFKKEIEVLNNDFDSVEEKEIYSEKLNDMVEQHLYKFSDTNIICEKFTNHEGKIQRIYKLREYVTPYFMFNGNFSHEDGERRGQGIRYFRSTSTAYFEYHKPITWIINFPAAVKGENIEENISIYYNNKSNINAEKHIMNFKTFMTEERLYARYKNDDEFLLGYIYEFEFIKEDRNEDESQTISILNDVIKDENVRRFLQCSLKIDRYNELYRSLDIYIYKGSYRLENSEFSLGTDFNIKVKNVSYNTKYFIDIFIKKSIIERFNELLRNEPTLHI